MILPSIFSYTGVPKCLICIYHFIWICSWKMWIVLLWVHNFCFCKWCAMALSLFHFSTQLCFEDATTFDTKWQLTVYISLFPEETVLFFDFFLQTQRKHSDLILNVRCLQSLGQAEQDALGAEGYHGVPVVAANLTVQEVLQNGHTHREARIKIFV